MYVCVHTKFLTLLNLFSMLVVQTKSKYIDTLGNKIIISDGDAVKALEARPGDKQARDFIKKQRQKMPGKQFFSLS